MIEKIVKSSLSVFSDIKYYKYPFFLLYDPGSYKIKSKDIKKISEIIKPGDIILRKYNNYLDGLFIPGKYSHAAICIGFDEIVHSTKRGVNVEDVMTFCRCDAICILRPKNITEESKNNAISYVKSKIGKEYDFFFNAENEETFYCSELIYWAYKDIINFEIRNIKKMFGLLKAETILPTDFLDFKEKYDLELITEIYP